MIRTANQGKFKLFETFDKTTILELDGNQNYAWVSAGKIGDILIFSKNKFKESNILSMGNYRIYEVKDEPELTDLEHLELYIGDGKWQGYLLPTGLPKLNDKRNRIIATNELITKSTH